MTTVKATLPGSSPVTFHVANDLSNERCKEENWAQMVISNLERDEEVTSITWSGHHASPYSEVVPCISGLYPLFRESSTDPAMILHAMQLVMKSVAYLNPAQKPVITGDQPIYAIMKKISVVSSWPCRKYGGDDGRLSHRKAALQVHWGSLGTFRMVYSHC